MSILLQLWQRPGGAARFGRLTKDVQTQHHAVRTYSAAFLDFTEAVLVFHAVSIHGDIIVFVRPPLLATVTCSLVCNAVMYDLSDAVQGLPEKICVVEHLRHLFVSGQSLRDRLASMLLQGDVRVCFREVGNCS